MHSPSVGPTTLRVGFHLLKGDWAKARSLIEHWIAVIRPGNIGHWLPDAVAASARVLAQVGDTRLALARFREGEELLDREAAREIVGFRGDAHCWLGRAGLLLGQLDDAQSLGAGFGPR